MRWRIRLASSLLAVQVAHADQLTEIATLTGHTAQVNSLKFVDNDQALISSDGRHGLFVWDLRSKRARLEQPADSRGYDYSALAWLGSRSVLLTASFSGRLSAVGEDGDLLFAQKREVILGKVGFLSMGISQDERFFVTADNSSRTLLLGSTETWKILWEIDFPHVGWSNDVSFSESGEFIFAASTCAIDVIRASDGVHLRQILPAPVEKCAFIEETWFSSDHRFGILALNPQTTDMTIAVLDLQTSKLLYSSAGQGAILAARLSPDQTELLLLRDQGDAVFERHDLVGKRITESIRSPEFFADGIELWQETSPPFDFSSDLRLVAGPGANNTVRIFRFR